MSIGLDRDQARHLIGPDLGSNCLQRLSALAWKALTLKAPIKTAADDKF